MDWLRARGRGRRTRAGYQRTILPDDARIPHGGPGRAADGDARVTDDTPPRAGGRSRAAQRTGGRSQPGGSSSGSSQSAGGAKSHQVPSKGNSPASASRITRSPSARTAFSSVTQ